MRSRIYLTQQSSQFTDNKTITRSQYLSYNHEVILSKNWYNQFLILLSVQVIRLYQKFLLVILAVTLKRYFELRLINSSEKDPTNAALKGLPVKQLNSLVTRLGEDWEVASWQSERKP